VLFGKPESHSSHTFPPEFVVAAGPTATTNSGEGKGCQDDAFWVPKHHSAQASWAVMLWIPRLFMV
jgi:hypothetical protein